MKRAAAPAFQPESVYVRHTDKDGRSFVEEHRVWNRAIFMQARARDAAKVGGEAKVELLTEEQYRKERGKTKRKRT